MSTDNGEIAVCYYRSPLEENEALEEVWTRRAEVDILKRICAKFVEG